jgi:hypothetical protein
MERHMTQLIKAIFIATFSFFFSLNTFADGHEQPSFIPLEGFACNYSPGKDMDDLLQVTKTWNDYMDDGGSKYSAWLFTPYFYSEDEAADVFWIGVSPTWEELAKGEQHMSAPKGQKINAQFNKIVPCYDHTNWGYESVRSSSGSSDDDEGVVTIMWCTLAEGVTYEDVLAADEKFNAYEDSTGSATGVGRWWPGSGIPSRFTADFLWAQGVDSMQSWGQSVDRAVNGGGNQATLAIYGELMSCDNRAVYKVKSVRQ